LEAVGIIGQIEQEIAASPELSEQVTRAHRSYIEERRHLLSRQDLAYIEENGMLPALMVRGIGGIADFTRIKCLHLHVAHALAAQNPVGKIVLDRLDQRECSSDSVICASF